MRFFDVQLPELKSKPKSKLELSFGEDNNHLHVLASLDGKSISKITIDDSKDDFYDKFKEWIDEFSEILFLNVIPPCLRSYYIFKIYGEKIRKKLIPEGKEYYCFNNIFDLVRKDNRESIGKVIEEKKKVFEPFFTTKKEGKGTGLGMSVSYSILERHKVDVEIETEKNVETKFTLFFNEVKEESLYNY